MLNNEKFIIRLKELLVNNGLSAAAFSERIGVQRSSVSHILSSRNKPSLDFILKIHEAFKEVSLEWLLYGTTNQDQHKEVLLQPEQSQPSTTKTPDLFESVTPKAPTPSTLSLDEIKKNNSPIDHVIEFYKDGSFTVFYPNS